VALSIDTLVVTSKSYDDSVGLPVFVYHLNTTTGLWGPNADQKLLPRDDNALIYAGFGNCVDMSGDWIIVGTVVEAFYFYGRTPENSTYTMTTSLKGFAFFGQSVAIAGRVALCGTKNEIHVYRRNNETGLGLVHGAYKPWLIYQSPYGQNGGTYGIGALAMTEEYFMVADAYLGEVYLYVIPPLDMPAEPPTQAGGIAPKEPLVVYRGKGWSNFGYSLSMTGRHAMVGSYIDKGAFNSVFFYANLVTSPPCMAGSGLQGDEESGTASCTLCAAGAYSIGGDDHCHSCPFDEYADAVDYIGAHSCTLCETGRRVAYIGSGHDHLSNHREYESGINNCVGLVDAYYDYEAQDSLECECSFYGFQGLHISAFALLGILITVFVVRPASNRLLRTQKRQCRP